MSDPAIVDLIVLVLDTGPIHEHEDEDDIRIWVAHHGSQQPAANNPEPLNPGTERSGNERYLLWRCTGSDGLDAPFDNR
jgi:hypothetical protein